MSDERGGLRRMTITDPQVMRALAHPARLAILDHLSSTEEAVTATGCAEVVGLSPSATSYHLRALARAGMVEEAPSRGDARERLWRSAAPTWTIDAGQNASPETRAAEQALIEVFVARHLDRVRNWLARAGDTSKEWYDAAMMSDTTLLITADELTELNTAVLALMEPYKRRNRLAGPATEGARVVAAHYVMLPLD
nr:helix-turn-helix domain-containing protein [Micromonospora sp. DSM 115978]